MAISLRVRAWLAALREGRGSLALAARVFAPRTVVATVLAAGAVLAACSSGGPTDAPELEGSVSDALAKPNGTNGDIDYCSETVKCISGEGHCEGHTECTGTGIQCLIGVGPKFNQPVGNNVCAPSHCTNGVKEGNETAVDCGGPCGRCPDACADRPGGVQYLSGGNHYCRGCYCGSGEGDCDSTYECAPGLVCAGNFGKRFGFSDVTDVCVPHHCYNDEQDWALEELGIDCGGPCGTCDLPCPGAAGGDNFCSACQCTARQGDCDFDRECAPGLLCLANHGPRFGWSIPTDVCLPSHCGNGWQDANLGEEGIDCGGECGPCLPLCSGTAGGDDFCVTCRCAAGQGDCDVDRDCAPDLYCASNAGAAYGFSPGTDVCKPKPCTSTANCPTGHYCSQAGECRSDSGGGCGTTGECASDQVCRNGMCDCASCEPSCTCSTGGPCDANEDCNFGLTCVGGTCQDCANHPTAPECVDCPNGMDENGDCFPEPEPCVPGNSCPSTGPSCDLEPCPPGLVCPTEPNGWRHGKPNQRICEPPGCCDDPSEWGTTTPECGLCLCQPDCSTKQCGDTDLDNGCGQDCEAVCDPGENGCTTDAHCSPGHICKGGACVPSDVCGGPVLAPPNCGPGSVCGPCPPTPSNSCEGRVCGIDPDTNANCGSCGGDAFCNGAGQCVANDDTPTVEVPRADGGMRPVPPGVAPAAPALFGTTPGTFAVTERGSSSYSIPLELPPGRAGVVPNLAVRYTSTTANGALGIGWSLDGFSSISRCPRVYAQDGFARAVAGNTSDAYCLDGQRLVETSPGSGEYRTQIDTFSKIVRDGTTATGPLSFKVYTKDGRILSYGSSKNSRSLLRWPVVGTWALDREEDRVGNYIRIEYAQTTTDLTASGEASTSEMVPRVVTYTGFGNTDGDREIRFQYGGGRGDTLTGFRVGGGAFARARLLTAIEVLARNAIVRRYFLNYETSPNLAERLISIQECVGPGTTPAACRNPTQFSYYDEEGFFEEGVVKPIPLEEGRSVPPPFVANGIVHKSDEGRDLLTVLMTHQTPYITQPIPPGANTAVSVVPVAGPVAATVIDIINLFGRQEHTRNLFESFTFDMVASTRLFGSFMCLSNEVGEPAEGPAPSRQLIGNAGWYGAETIRDTCPKMRVFFEAPAILYQPRSWLIDLDGDGVQDLLYCAEESFGSDDFAPMHLDYKLANAKSSSDPKPPQTQLHADRDGEIPLHGNICNPRSQDQYSIVIDIDNDGTGNLVARDPEAGWSVLMPNASGTGYTWSAAMASGLLLDAAYSYYVTTIDANGDGLRDLIGMPNPDAPQFANGSVLGKFPVVALNTGSGFRQRFLAPFKDGVLLAGGTYPRYGAYTVDLDHDGVEELVFADPNTPEVIPQPGIARPWRIGRVRGGAFVNDTLSTLVEGPGVLGDFDGDGNIDAFTQAVTWGINSEGKIDSFPQPFRFHAGKGRRQNLLYSATNGVGHRTVIAYDDANPNGDTYTKYPTSGTCKWPQRCVARPSHPLVSEHIEMHFLDQDRSVPRIDRFYTYQYEGARIDTAGYGWLGFSERHVTVEDAEGEFQGKTSVVYEEPESWDVATSTVPYLYLKAGRVKSQREEAPKATSAISSSNNHFIATQRTFQYTEQTSTAGRPFGYLSTATTETFDIKLDGVSVGIPMMIETGTTQRDEYGNATVEETIRQDYKWIASGATLQANTKTIDRTATEFNPTPAEVNDWLISLPKSVTAESTPRCESGQCAALKKSRTTNFTYYPDTDLVHTVTRPSSNISLEASTELIRDEWGNVTETIATNGDGDTRHSTVTFDNRGLFPIRASALGEGVELTTQLHFDDRFGKMDVRADPNGIDEVWSFDVFGVNRTYAGPNGQFSTDYSVADYYLAEGFDLPAAALVTRAKVGGDRTDEELNSFGQTVRRTSYGFNGVPVHEEFGYDYRARLIAKSRPHTPGDTTQGKIRYTYDNLDRPTVEHRPDGTQILTDFTNASTRGSAIPDVPGAYSYVRSTDQRGHATVTAYNRDGQPVAVIDPYLHQTTYRYTAFGQLATITDSALRTIDFGHDDYGRLTSIADQARGGAEIKTVNGFGEVIGGTDAAGRVSIIHYDDFGRIVTLDDDDGLTSWLYGTTGENEVGRVIEATSPSGQRMTFGYEPRENTRNRGLPNETTQELYRVGAGPGATPEVMTTRSHFDAYSRLEQVDYPVKAGAAVAVKYEFDAYGHTKKVFNANSTSQVYWQLVAAEQGYRIKQERLGAHICGSGQGSLTTRTYYPTNGLPHTIQTECGAQTLQSVSYTYDAAGNLQGRSTGGLSESFLHDKLNRLIEASSGGTPTVPRYAYDQTIGRGRMTWQVNVGDYAYDATQGRDWVVSAGATTYEHDDVGNVVTRTGPDVPGGFQTIDYTTFDLPKKVTSGSAEVEFAYSANGDRVVKQSVSQTSYYLGQLYNRTVGSAATSQRFSITVGGRTVAQLSNTVEGTTPSAMSVRYFHDDSLGSIGVISDASGASVTTRTFSPFGKASAPLTETPYGFTGHESDDDLGLINMKGRIYDPHLAQFLSADPVIQQPYSQGLNRFAYVNNSPLNFTDPTGLACRNPNSRDCSATLGPSLQMAGGVAGGVGVGIGIGLLSQLGAGPTAISSTAGGGAAGIGGGLAGPSASPGAASVAVSPGALAQPEAFLAHGPVSGPASFASAGISMVSNDALFGHQKTTSIGGEGNRSGGALTGGTPGRGGTPNAASPVTEQRLLQQVKDYDAGNRLAALDPYIQLEQDWDWDGLHGDYSVKPKAKIPELEKPETSNKAPSPEGPRELVPTPDPKVRVFDHLVDKEWVDHTTKKLGEALENESVKNVLEAEKNKLMNGVYGDLYRTAPGFPWRDVLPWVGIGAGAAAAYGMYKYCEEYGCET